MEDFDRVYAAHQARIFSFLLRLCRRRDLADDLAQETWLRFARATQKDHPNVTALLFTIARNVFRSHCRWSVLDLSRFFVPPDDVVPPDVAHERREEIARLELALARLPVSAREVLLLVGVEGMEQETAAEVLNISYDALRQRLARARAMLDKEMKRWS